MTGRIEDPDLLRGIRPFLADIACPGALHAGFVRSPVAHGRVVSIDAEAALARPGVVAVHDAESLPLPLFRLFGDLPDGLNHLPLDPLVRHVGAPVAVVVATSPEAVADAIDLIDIEIDRFRPIPTPDLDAPPLYPARADNLVHRIDDSDRSDPLGGIETETIVELSIRNQRIASAPIECDGILATPETDGRLDVWCTSQGVQSMRNQLAQLLGLDVDRMRVRSAAVGGGFGGRASAIPEFVVVIALARELGRPIRWVQDRYENLTGMAQGRGYESMMRVGLDANLAMTGLDVDLVADAGSSAHVAGLLMVSVRRQATGLYRVPALRWSGSCVLSTTTPVGAYRGAGQPEANHARERLLDAIARRVGVDPIEFRRHNLATADEFPLPTLGGVTYDRADPHAALDMALDRVGLDHWRTEQAGRRSRADHVEIGIGIANYAQSSGRGTPVDAAQVEVRADGSVVISCASPTHGQGHLTTWAGLVADRLGIDPNRVVLIDADTDAMARGQSTGGSRSSQVAASALVNACQDVIDQARPLAAAELEASPEDLVVVAAGYGLEAGLAVVGVPTRRVTWSALAARQSEGCLEAARYESLPDGSYPYGTHASVVEVDIETGAVALLAHVAVDDCGTVLQPALVEGQQHGGAVAGIAQALFEHSAVDDDANPLAATFATYLMPAASELCSIDAVTIETPTENNQLGTRGIGENGCNAATGSVHNAVIDALYPRGVEHIDLPLTPQAVWQALRVVESNSPARGS